jgi:hypothetical protein
LAPRGFTMPSHRGASAVIEDKNSLSYFQFRGLLAFGLLFGGLFIYAAFDLVFLLIGREGTATVSEVYKTSSRHGDSWHLEFKYKDAAGNERLGKEGLGDSSGGYSVGDQFAIQYLPIWLLDAPDAARPKRPFSMPVFAALIFVTTGLSFFAYRAIYHSDDGPKSRSRRK